MDDNNDKLLITFAVAADDIPDIALMKIWVQALHHFDDKLNAKELQAALSWFVSYTKTVIDLKQ